MLKRISLLLILVLTLGTVALAQFQATRTSAAIAATGRLASIPENSLVSYHQLIRSEDTRLNSSHT